ncbi:hypothetical protein BT69DRAFT_1292643 [Atractiella rhizophila]|nr:hypothetical protein BT69DRAFT_1292643 [Atractiella rhizophila]
MAGAFRATPVVMRQIVWIGGIGPPHIQATNGGGWGPVATKFADQISDQELSECGDGDVQDERIVAIACQGTKAHKPTTEPDCENLVLTLTLYGTNNQRLFSVHLEENGVYRPKNPRGERVVPPGKVTV